MTPLVPQIDEIKVAIQKENLNLHNLTWVGKVTHILKNVTETKQVTMTALVHQIGVYDLNQIYFEVAV